MLVAPGKFRIELVVAAVGDHRFQIEAVGFGDGAFVFGQADEDRAALLAELRDVVADVAQALHDDALAGQAGSEPERAHVVVDGAHFAQREVQPAARGFAPAADAALADGLARHARQRVETVGRQRLVGVDDPRHLALARAVIRRRHVHARTDEVLLDQLVRVPPRHAFELVERQLARVHLDRALGAAKRHVDDRALPGHQRRQRHHLVLVDVGAVADAAFHRQLVMAVLGAPRLHDGDRAVVVPQRKLEPVQAVACLDLIEQSLRKGGEDGRAVEAAIDVVEKTSGAGHRYSCSRVHAFTGSRRYGETSPKLEERRRARVHLPLISA